MIGRSALRRTILPRRLSRRFQACGDITAVSPSSQLCFITQACGFRDQYLQIEEKNAVVFGISPDGVTSHQKFKTKYDLPFVLLADEDHSVAEAYAVWGERSMYGKKFMGIIRSHFVVDESGTLVDVQYNVKPADSVERALAALG